MAKHPCYILPPHILDHMSKHQDPRVKAAAEGTSIATNGFRVQRALLAMVARPSLPTGELQRTIYDAQQGPQLPGQRVRSEGALPTADAAIDESYDSSGVTYHFYDQVFKRKSVDGRGMRLDSTVHYREDPNEGFDNAFWNGEQMIYGDGDGVLFGRFTQSLDVVAHELTHGVTQFEAGLEYHKQPGALNESMSDVFGTMVRQWLSKETVAEADWLIGKELFLAPGSALRSMKAPGTAYDNSDIGKDPQPDHMRNYADLPDTRGGDWGGVHVNSGIPNRAFYLACVNLGASFSWEKAGPVWYDALTKRLSATASFADAARATVAAATEIFGPNEANAVRNAWDTVGVA